ncbi:MAG TPA: response regulator [Pyrinomonadaceae bacterium]|jgi:DNA-binding response OmpR family regulator|nr:response regulator [Pyrinomonadaceae bacterium]
MARPILIIEDDPDIADILRYGLEKEAFEARIAQDGEAGLAASLDQDPPSLILLDFLLPGMNGVEVCRRLRREPSTATTPIVMLTAKTSPADCASALAAGATDYITKPFVVRSVIDRVISLVN